MAFLWKHGGPGEHCMQIGAVAFRDGAKGDGRLTQQTEAPGASGALWVVAFCWTARADERLSHETGETGDSVMPRTRECSCGYTRPSQPIGQEEGLSLLETSDWKAGAEKAKDPAPRRQHKGTEHRGHCGERNLSWARIYVGAEDVE